MTERQRPSEHGRAVGKVFAGLADAMAVRAPQLDTRCSTCAFSQGTIPNQMSGTLLDVMRIVAGVDDSVFMCHHAPGVVSGRCQPTTICAGYLLTQQATRDEIVRALEQAHGALIDLASEPAP